MEGSSSNTKAALTETNNKLEMTWTTGDAFVMYVGDNNTPAVYTLSESSSGSSNGIFTTTSTAEGQLKGAAYPYVENGVSYDGSYLEITLPSEITYDPNIPTKCNAPMWGTIANNEESISFKHLASLLRIDCSNLPSGYNKLTVTASSPISGKFKVRPNNSEPILAQGENDADGNNKSISVKFDPITDASQSENAFYIPIPSGTYSSLSVTISNGTNDRLVRCWTNITFKRAYYYTAKVDCQYIDASDATTVNTKLTEIVTTQNTTAQVVIESDSLDITQPFKTPDVTNSNVTMVFPQNLTTTESSPLKIESANKTAEASESDRILSIDVPMSDDTQGAYVEVETPTTTVNITGGKFKAITATTATNTLIVGNGVEIESLTVKAGNVRIQNGSSVNSLKNESDEEILLIIEDGASKPETIDPNNKVKVITSIEYDLMNTPDGTVYNLTSDMELTEPLYIANKVTVELNGYRITHKHGDWNDPNGDKSLIVIKRGGTLTVNNSTGDGRISVLNHNTNDGNPNNTNIYSCIKMTAYGESANGDLAKLVLNNGYIEGNYYCITGNGNRHDTYIEINGGWISSLGGEFHQDVGSETLGIYHPQNGTIVINGGTIKGYESAIEMRGGELTAQNATFEVEPVTTEFSIRQSNSGNTLIGTAIGISPYSGRSVKATITNSTLIGPKALHEEYLYDGNAPETSIKIDGGRYKGAIYSENADNIISNGTFYDPSAFDYLANNAKVYLADSMQLTKAITIDKTVTVDLCGHKIENKTAGHPSNITPEVDDECVVFMVTGNGNLTIEGNGTVKATGDGVNTDYNTAVWAMGANAKAVIKGGSYSNEKDTEGDGCDLIYAQDGAKIEIHGGDFKSYIRSTLGKSVGGVHDVLNCKDDSNSVITVYGGKFLNYAPSLENVGNGEVILAEGKKVYNESSAEVTTAHDHTSETDVWYEVR